MRRPASGTVAEVQNITSQQTYQAYQEMLAHDKIDIVVVGDVDEAAVCQAMRALDFSPRQSPLHQSLLYHQAARQTPAFATEVQPLAQAKLDLAYHLPAYYRQDNYLTAIVLNGLLGGTRTHCCLPTCGRRLVIYYATSSLRAFSGEILVETGINPADQTQARALIEQQVADLAAGKFNDAQFQRVKEDW